MGGHGGLNITMQKSYAPYSRKNRERVEKDERELAESLAAAAEKEAIAASALRLASMRGDTAPAAPETPAAPREHINLFAVEEAEQLREEAAREKGRREQAHMRSQMPELELGRSAADRPWYAQQPNRNGPFALAQPSGVAALAQAQAQFQAQARGQMWGQSEVRTQPAGVRTELPKAVRGRRSSSSSSSSCWACSSSSIPSATPNLGSSPQQQPPQQLH
mmetsp:Transcript_14053/g.35788  ORF Transcript_14053/g.35788 Transcript_14053/m.35788 type:complete len:220 (-) Transcript_14053:6-665(-)